MSSKDVKREQLEMNPATAANRLKKMILFSLIKTQGLESCYHCGEAIENVEDLSIEHKVPWLHSENPKELYFDLENIAFSHLKCNVASARKDLPRKHFSTPHGTITGWTQFKCRCEECRKAHAEYERIRRRKLRQQE